MTLDLTEQEVAYLVNVALAAQPIRDALPLLQKIAQQAQASQTPDAADE